MSLTAAEPYPILTVQADSLPRAWEESVRRCWEEGIPITTEYDRPDSPPSKDCMMVIQVMEPFAEPRLHRAFPAGLKDLERYRQEVLYGIHDSWIRPEEGKWQYTYHQRLFAYPVPSYSRPVDQLSFVVDKLANTPYSRRAQAVTWQCWTDPSVNDPPCLQRLWFRIVQDRLLLSAHLRSNDAFKAAFMNMFAFTELQRLVAEKIAAKRGKPLPVGPYIHVADSYHIYGDYFQDFEAFLDTVRSRTYQQRTWTTAFAEPFFAEARAELANNKDDT